ncbi:hypothetical protein [Erythrobacter rubeus]|uniref:Lipoprotein n=1 Tax=Erythrobacter rubeus TaxID=2760803 RepID=A0ABR8KKM6_9SPHN|nr:hypothetical protein [Erythrobacter rubeus]MBD2840849.1 hypothetical protein [Erythrobacter rubeus]
MADRLSRSMTWLLAGSILLGGCGSPEEAPREPDQAEIGNAPVSSEPKADDGASDAVSGEADSAMIPARYHGVWDFEGGTCERTSDLLMEISASEILFYESLGLVTATEPDGDDVIVTLDMEGEGETWTQQTRFSLVGEGDELRLHTSDGEQPKEADTYPSKRCAD